MLICAQRAHVAAIQVLQGPDKGRKFELAEGENILGRQSRSVPLKDGTISRQHSRIVKSGRDWVLEDLGSANGTFLNGVRVTRPSPLKLGDQIRIGSTLLVFARSAASEPAASVEVDEDGMLVDAAIVATLPSNEDSVIIPTPEAGAQAIGNLRILYDLIAEVGSIFDVDELLTCTLDRIFSVVKADRGFIMLADETGKLQVRAARAGTPRPHQDIPVSRTIINEVMGKQVGVLSSNAMSDKRFTSGKSVHNFGIRSAVCVPIKGRDRILGVIHVDCGVSEHTYSTEQLRLLTAIGYQTGLAVENVRLYEQAVQQERLAAVGETVAFLSHHIKNVLQALMAGIDLVEMALHRDDLGKAKDAWPIVQRNLARINEQILNMLAFSKSREPLLENVNVNHVLGECVELVTARADERGVAILTQLDDLPPIPADTAGLQQAFLNLLHNALDAVEDKTGSVTLTSEYDSLNRRVVVRVSDNGSGIEAEKLPDIFTPFYSSKGQKGTGLGLAVARKVFEEHRGRIEAESKPGHGTTFTVILPAQAGGDATETKGPVAK